MYLYARLFDAKLQYCWRTDQEVWREILAPRALPGAFIREEWLLVSSIYAFILILYCKLCVGSSGQPPSKKKRFVTLPKVTSGLATWVSEYNLDGKVVKSQNEVGDGASSRVYKGTFNGDTVAVKQLKCYSPRLSSALIKVYERLFHLNHTNIVKVYGICPKAGQIVMEYCEKLVGDFTIHTLSHMQVHLGSDMPVELRLLALSDAAEGLEYLHSQGLVNGDIKPQNVLVSGQTEEEYIFRITDYCGITINNQISSSISSTFKQFMTPGYVCGT